MHVYELLAHYLAWVVNQPSPMMLGERRQVDVVTPQVFDN
jgi:hypothetical protein